MTDYFNIIATQLRKSKEKLASVHDLPRINRKIISVY